MPVTTRAMRRGQGNGSASQQSSSRTAAGPSRNNGRSSQTQRQTQASRRTAGRGGDDDSDDDDDDDRSDDSGDEDAATMLRRQNNLAALEIAAALDQALQAPRELFSANPRDNPQRRLADAMASRFRDQADLNILRSVLSQAEALERVSTNFRKRYQTILSSIAVNVENSSRGMSVAEGLRAFRTLANAIGQHIEFYLRQRALPDNGHGLVAILVEMLSYITDLDEDIYATASVSRAQYAGGGNTGNIFREFVREHVGIMDVLLRLPVPLLRERAQIIRAVIDKVREHGATNGDRAQFQQLINLMHRVWQRMQAE